MTTSLKQVGTKLLFSAICVLCCLSAFSEIDVFDFGKWDGVVTQTNGWTFSEIKKYKTGPLVGAAYFPKVGARICSPRYSRPILSVTVESATTSTAIGGLSRVVTLYPTDGAKEDGVVLRTPQGLFYEAEKIDLASREMSSFVLEAVSGRGNWAVSRVFVVYGEQESPVEDEKDDLNFNFWKLSEFLPKPGFRELDLSCLGTVKKRRVWENGIDGDGIYGFADINSARGILRPATEKSVYGGIYCFNAGTEENPKNGLGLLASTSTGVRLVLPIRLNTERRPTRMTISYAVCEVKRGEADQTTLFFDWMASNDIASIDEPRTNLWTTVSDGVYVAPAGSEVRHVDIPIESVRDAKYLLVRWSVRKQARSSLIGLHTIRVEGALCKWGLLLIAR